MSTTFWARTDNGTANNPALNLTGDPALQITFVASGTNGDWTLEQPPGGGVDPDTQVSIGGTSYDFTFELSGTMPTQKRDGAQQVPDQFEGSVVYIITVQDYPAPGETTRLAFMPQENATQADMDAFGNGAIDVQNVDETPAPAPVCFAKGTRILTSGGEVAVENLRVGDRVETLDDGPLPILWISRTALSWPLETSSGKPIAISAGALGKSLPARDLVVSPQHKMLLQMRCANDRFAQPQFLAPTKGMVSMRGVRIMKGKKNVEYYHVLLAKHAILFAEGAPSESFYPGPSALKMLNARQRETLCALFPGLSMDPPAAYGPPARTCLSWRETEEMVARIRPDGMPPMVA